MSEVIKIHDKKFVPYLTASQIQERVAEIAGEINRDFYGRTPIFVSILNGSFIFTADLFKKLKINAEVCFIKLASYKGVRSSGKIITAIGLDVQLHNRDVIILEDIVDTGKTLNEFLPQVLNHHPASLSVCSLLHKPEASVHQVHIDYLGFSIPNKFVVGYGLDYDGLGRNLDSIYQLF